PTFCRCCRWSTERLCTSTALPLTRREHDRDLTVSPGDRVSVKHRFLVGREGVVGHPRQDLFESDLELQARQVGAEATVHTGPESEVPVLAAIQDASIRLGELLDIAVGRGVIDHYGFSGAERMPGQLDFPCDGSGYSVNRSGEPNELFD